MRYDLAILGAGPVGLEAASAASRAGENVVVLEAERAGHHVGMWGHVRMFTPAAMNMGPVGRATLQDAGSPVPDNEALQTGREFRESYLLPLAELLHDRIDLREGHRVVAVSRGNLLKGDLLGDPRRAEVPFRILYEDGNGTEGVVEATRVFDCTGTYGKHNYLGPGGTPAVGERTAQADIVYHIPDVRGADRDKFASRRIALVGGGHSAATTTLYLAELAGQEPDTHLLWLTRSAQGPLPEIPNDPLPTRASLTAAANRAAREIGPTRAWIGGASIESTRKSNGHIELGWSDGEQCREQEFDLVVANVGYEPDDGLYRQLQIHECYASRGPMKLAAALLAAQGDGPADCLAAADLSPDALVNPEPGYLVLGMKSYGKNSAFLLQHGYAQVPYP